jgi:Protein of unknown function (DUF1761)
VFEADINYLAVLLAGLASQPLGFVWYGPLFSRAWMKAHGYDEATMEGGESPAPYVLALLFALVIAYSFARLADMVGADSVGDCIALAAFVWAGFAGSVQAVQAVFNQAPDKVGVFAIEGGYQLANFLVIGFVVGLFQ